MGIVTNKNMLTWTLALCAGCVAGSFLLAQPNKPIRTYTVKTPVWETTNAIEVIPNHEKKNPPCTLVRYLQDGKTNEFHAWAVPVVVITNK